MQAGQDALTDNFISQAGYEYTADDTNRTLARRFQRSGQPIFAIINGVADSPSHKQWELLLHQNGYGTTRHPIDLFRSVIDSVRAPAETLPPAIVTQPRGQVVKSGTQAVLTVAATGSDPLTYQWKFKDVDITGATRNTLVLSDITLNQAGEYSVLIENPAGSIESQAAQLEVEPTSPPKFSHSQRLADGSFEVRLSVELGVSLISIEASSDLSVWTPIATVTPTGGLASFRDTQAGNYQQRFYRTR